MSNFPPMNRANLSGHEGHHCYRLAIQRGKFDFIPFSASMNEDDRTDIPSSEAMLRKVTFQDDVLQLLNHGILPFRG